MNMDSLGRVCGFLGFVCFISKNNYAAIVFIILAVILLRLNTLKVDRQKVKKYSPLDTRVRVNIKFEALNDVKFKGKSILKILQNKKNTVGAFIIRETLNNYITIIMLKEDGDEEMIKFPVYRVFARYFEFE